MITPPTSITVAATDATGTVATNTAIVAFLAAVTASDNVDTTLIITNDAPAQFPLGVTTVTFSATDLAGNTGSAEATVTITDQTAPVVTPPTSITVAATDATGTAATDTSIAAFLAAVAAIDNVDTTFTITNDAPAQFPLGVTTVTFSATDLAGNTASAEATVTVTDQTAPVISLVGITPFSLEQGDSYTDAGATASDNVDGDITASITTTSTVNTAVVGNYTVTYSISDAAGNAAVAVVRDVTVTPDVTAPVITPPTSITVAATDATGTAATNTAIATFLAAVTAIDNVDTTLIITNDAPATFPLGPTIVTFSATDATGNTGTAEATMTITDQTAGDHAPDKYHGSGDRCDWHRSDQYSDRGLPRCSDCE